MEASLEKKRLAVTILEKEFQLTTYSFTHSTLNTHLDAESTVFITGAADSKERITKAKAPQMQVVSFIIY